MTADDVLIERVATMLSPAAWEGYRGVYLTCLSKGVPSDKADCIAYSVHGPEREASLQKAREIAAVVLEAAVDMAKEWKGRWANDARRHDSEIHEAGEAVAANIATAIRGIGEERE